MLTDGLDWCGLLWCFIRLSFWRHPFTAEHPLTLILTAPIHCRASIDCHSDGTHSLQSIHWLSFWRHPFTAEHPLTLILTAPIHCRASIDSHSDGTHSLQSIHWCYITECYISPNRMRKQTHPNLGWPADEHVFIFACLIPLSVLNVYIQYTTTEVGAAALLL